MLELSAQEEVEVLMKILEGQQGEVLNKLMHLKTVCKDMTQLKHTLATQFSSLAESNAANKGLLAQIKDVKGEELQVREKLSSAEAEKARLTASLSKVRTQAGRQAGKQEGRKATQWVVSSEH